MKIVNSTHWRTSDLKRIAARVTREEFPRDRFGDRAKKITVYVGYNRGGANNTYSSGHAPYHSNYCTVNVPSGTVDQVDFAHVIAHELGHCKGLRHGHMPPHMESYNVVHRSEYIKTHFAWAKLIPVRQKPAKIKMRPTVDVKLAHALKMVARAETRVKRATTILKKWKYAVKRHQRKLVLVPCAACPPEVKQ